MGPNIVLIIIIIKVLKIDNYNWSVLIFQYDVNFFFAKLVKKTTLNPFKTMGLNM